MQSLYIEQHIKLTQLDWCVYAIYSICTFMVPSQNRRSTNSIDIYGSAVLRFCGSAVLRFCEGTIKVQSLYIEQHIKLTQLDWCVYAIYSICTFMVPSQNRRSTNSIDIYGSAVLRFCGSAKVP